MQFTMTHKHGFSQVFCAPTRLPVEFDTYVFKESVTTSAEVIYMPGDTLEIIERTREHPNDLNNSLGNLRVRCKHFPEGSVWTGIELMINEGLIEWVPKPEFKIKVMHDPGHAWGSVKLALLKELGIEKEITHYSYMRGKSAYLEEDCDLPTVTRALRKKGYDVVFVSSHTDKRSPIRSYDSYKPTPAPHQA